MDIQQIHQFRLGGAVVHLSRFGNGHINDTYLVVVDTGQEYVLQRINQSVFKDARAVMENIAAVTAHLRATAHTPREVLALVPTVQGAMWLEDEAGAFWRLFNFISDSVCLEKAETPEDFFESARAFGRFQKQLEDFPAHTLHETIPDFHNTPSRYAQLKAAISADARGRVKETQKEIDFALGREDFAHTLVDAQRSGELPLRVTHNDTKLNNVLFDRPTRKALCVIDLDTVMPGLSVNDFGDSIRFGASTAAEDERDLDKVRLSLPLFEAYAKGFLEVCSPTPGELRHLTTGSIMMTLECGVRFLTDYIAGDTYFHTQREGQNLDRCRTQFKLVAEMERNKDAMARIIEKYK